MTTSTTPTKKLPLVALAIGLTVGAVGAGVVVVQQLQSVKMGPILADVGPWTLTAHDDKAFGSADLKGKVWVGNFIFTRCAMSCPMLTAALKDVSDHVDDDGVRFVSFTVDPEFDTPQVLSTYRQGVNADDRWTFVTGSVDDVHGLLRHKMFAHVGEKVERPGADKGDVLIDIAHLQKLALFDKQGRLRATASVDDEGKALLQKQVAALLAEDS